MKVIIPLLIVIVVIVYIILSLIVSSTSTQEDYNNYIPEIRAANNFQSSSIKDNTVVLSPNIPGDPYISHHTGPAFVGNIADDNTPHTGKYKFPIERHLYDGIFEDKIINDNDGNTTRIWELTDIGSSIPYNNIYASDNYLHLSMNPKDNIN